MRLSQDELEQLGIAVCTIVAGVLSGKIPAGDVLSFVHATATLRGMDSSSWASVDPPSGRELLVRTLVLNEWNIARVARALGVTRRTIYLRLKRYGIKREKPPRSNTPREKRA